MLECETKVYQPESTVDSVLNDLLYDLSAKILLFC